MKTPKRPLRIVTPDLQTFYDNNPDIDLLTFDFFDSGASAQLKWPEGVDQELSISKLMTHQRILHVYPNSFTANALIERGFDSAYKIAALPEEEFVSMTGDIFSGNLRAARQAHQKAATIKGQVTHLWANVHSVVSSAHSRAMHAENIGDDIVNFFIGLPTYEELFGTIDYCECEHCKSIFGPAAYFVDIMRITDQYITKPNQTTIPPGLTLECRREGLFELPLTCATTNDLVQYIQIVNKVLEKRAAKELHTANVFHELALSVYPFNLPVNIFLSEIRLYADLLKAPLTEIFQVFAPPSQGEDIAVAREYMKLSIEQYELVITPTPEEAALKRYYGLGEQSLSTLNSEEFFLLQTGLTLDELTGLLNQSLSKAELAVGLAHQFYFNLPLPGLEYVSIVTPEEGGKQLTNLNLQTLDRINRFVRLAQWAGIDFESLNWQMISINATEITQQAIIALAQIKQAQALYGLPSDVMTAFWYDMKTVGAGHGDYPADLFDRVYNHPSLLKGTLPYHPLYAKNPLYIDPVQEWDIESTERVSSGFGRPRLMAALGVNDTLLTAMGETLFGTEAPVKLDVPNLSKLYRLSVILSTLRISLDDFLTLLQLLSLDLTNVYTLPNLIKVYLTVQWLRVNNLSVPELSYILTRSPQSVNTSAPRVPTLYNFMRTTWVLMQPGLLQPNSFKSDNIPRKRSEEAFTALLESNLELIVSVYADYETVFGKPPDTDIAVVLKPVTPEELAFLEQKLFTKKQIKTIANVLNRIFEEQVSLLNTQISTLLDTDIEIMDGLRYYVSKELPIGQFVRLLLTPVRECSDRGRNNKGKCKEYSTEWQKIIDFYEQLSWATFIVNTLGVSAAELVNMADYPEAYAITSPFEPSLDTLYSIFNLKALIDAFGVTEEDFLEYLSIPSDEDCDEGEKSAALSELTGWPQDQICRMSEYFGEGTAIYDTINGITKMNRGFDILSRTGMDAFFVENLLKLKTLKAATTQGWDTYKKTASSLVAVANAKYSSNWTEVNDKVVSNLDEQKRDALEWIVLWKLRQKDTAFVSTRQLYEFLLIDVEMSGCATTSQMVEAISAVQLYLQRCRLNLEVGVNKLPIPEVWWEWMMNYRIWEANRRIFLYPENYLIPSLRKSKTELFKALEDSLLQSDVTKESVESAYRAYLDGFSALTTLTYIDAYQCMVDDAKQEPVETLFLFTRTKAEPYTYYYNSRAINTYWGEWLKIDVPITSTYITPIYAFSRLFIFWVDLKQVSSFRVKTEEQKTASTNQVDFTATVRYSFYDFNGKWVAPQTLYKEQVVYVAPSVTPFNEASGYQLFDVKNLYWRKVNALSVQPENLNTQPENTSATEKIIIFYGPFLENNSTGTPFGKEPVPPNPKDSFENPFKYAFELNIYNSMLDVNQALRGPVRGSVPLIDAWTMNNDLNRDFVLRNTEFLLLAENRSPGIPPAFTPRLDVALSSLIVTPLFNIVRANYLGDYTSDISRGEQPQRVSATSFISEGINAAGSAQVYDDLKANGIIGSNGKVSPLFSLNTNLDFLFTGAPTKIKIALIAVVQEILVALRAADLAANQNSFLLEDIPAAGSESVFTDLQANNIIDNVGYVKQFVTSSTNLSFLFEGAPEDQKRLMISEVRRILFVYMGTPSLLATVAKENASTIMVKNQPSTFIFNNGDEAFMIDPDIVSMPAITEKMEVFDVPTRPKVFDYSFVTQDIDIDGSKTVYNDLVQNHTINSQGILSPIFSPRTDLSFLFGGEPEPKKSQLIAEVREILLSLSSITGLQYYFENDDIVIKADSFITYGIDAAASAEVFAKLKEKNIIGPDGIISSSFSAKTDLSFLFPHVTEPRSKAALTDEVRQILLTYYDATWHRNLHDLKFRFTRLTTGAVPRLSRSLFSGGIESLLSLSSQQIPVVPELPFTRYKPDTWRVIPPLQYDGTQVDFDGPYGLYYWELFFFSPQLIGTRLSADRRFEEAQEWFQYVFNPTTREQKLGPDSFMTPDISRTLSTQAYTQLRGQGIITAEDQVSKEFNENTSLAFLWTEIPASEKKELMIREVRNILLNYQLSKPSARFWQFQPFRNHTLQELQEILTDAAQIAIYNNNPFDPFAIARLRIGAFEKAIYMSYLDNLISWGDAFFTQYTWESLTTATLLYTYAYNLLGDKPVNEGPCPSQPPTDFKKIRAKYEGAPGGIPQFLIDMENFIPAHSIVAPELYGKPFNDIDAYFCVPENPQMLAYWDKVDDRLYKVRNCLDLEGKPLKLPLFPPPINPLDLVRASAAGRSALSVIEQQQAYIPPYRFTPMLSHARTLVSSVMQLGSALFTALSGRDSEALARLRASQDLAVLNMTTYVKTKQVESAKFTVEGLQESARAIKERQDFYNGLVKEYLSPAEIASITFSTIALPLKALSTGFSTASAIAHIVPQLGAPTSLNYGGTQTGNSLAKTATVFDILAQIAEYSSQISLTVAGYQRRSQDWQFQADQAGIESTQMQKQIDSAKVQLQIAQRELEIHTLTVQQAKDMQDFLTNKFDNKELYIWIAQRISSLYFQAYRLALDAALSTQSAYRYELNRDDNFINFNYWDSLKQGLYAGESLDTALNQMEHAYLQNNTRRLEVRKSVSLAFIAPLELVRLKTTGECTIALTEALYDFDYPGQYCRQIKSIEVNLGMGEDGPGELHATLSQIKNDLVLKPSKEAVRYLLYGGDEVHPDVRQNWQSQQQIAFYSDDFPSSALEGFVSYGDDRYLPFEGTGAVSEWTYSMPLETNHIDYKAITDLTITVSYTALSGGSKFRQDVEELLSGDKFYGASYFNLKEAFPDEWESFMTNHDDPNKQVLEFYISPADLPPNFKRFILDAVDFQMTIAWGLTMPASSQFMNLIVVEQELKPVTLEGIYGRVKYEPPLAQNGFDGAWQIEVQLNKMKSNQQLKQLLTEEGFLDPDAFEDIVIVLEYKACAFNC
jgi:hypothetical protein